MVKYIRTALEVTVAIMVGALALNVLTVLLILWAGK